MQPVDYADVESRLSGSDNLSSKMHPFPCSALLTCFGNTHENTPLDQPNASPLDMEKERTEATSAVCLQPSARAGSSIKQGAERGSEMFKASRSSEKHSHKSSSSSNHTAAQSVSASTESSVFAAKELSHEVIALCTHIPRPSIIHVPKVSALEVAIQQGKGIGSLQQSMKREEENPNESLSCIDCLAVKKGLMAAVLPKLIQSDSYSFPTLLSETLGDVYNNPGPFYRRCCSVIFPSFSDPHLF